MEIKVEQHEKELSYMLTMDESEFEEYANMVSSANLLEKRDFAPSVRKARQLANAYGKEVRS